MSPQSDSTLRLASTGRISAGLPPRIDLSIRFERRTDRLVPALKQSFDSAKRLES